MLTGFAVFILLYRLYVEMGIDAFDVDGADGTDGADEFTGTAAEAARCIDCWNFKFFAVWSFLFNHQNGAVWTVACAVSAFIFAGCREAEIARPNGDTDLNRCFFGACDALNRARRADFGTTRTFRTAEPALEVHFRLHECFQGGGGTKDVIGAGGNAKLAARATRRKERERL